MQDHTVRHEDDFSLQETVFWQSCCGFWLLPEHLQRMQASSDFFKHPFDKDELVKRLDDLVTNLTPIPHKIRMLVSPTGKISLHAEPEPEDRSPVRAAVALESIDTDNFFLYHNTSNRKVFEDALASRPGFDDVILWNSKGEVTQTCTGNIVLERNGENITPPVECGLYPGAYREKLLKDERFTVRPVMVEELMDFDNIYSINSVIGWRQLLLSTE